jgi:hypothetical protein
MIHCVVHRNLYVVVLLQNVNDFLFLHIRHNILMEYFYVGTTYYCALRIIVLVKHFHERIMTNLSYITCTLICRFKAKYYFIAQLHD